MAYVANVRAPVRRRPGMAGLGDGISGPLQFCIPDSGNYDVRGPGHWSAGGPYGSSGPCLYISAPVAAAAPANVTVETNVSPQISPIFQQQYQPSNSPLSAGTAQTAPAQGGQVGASASDIAAMLKQEQDAAAASQQQQMQAFEQALAAQQAAAQAAQVTASQAPAVQAVSPDASQAVSGSLDTGTAAPAPLIATPTGYSNATLILLGLGTVAAFMALQKGDKHGLRNK